VTAATYDIIGCGAVLQVIHLPVLQSLLESGEIQIAGCYDLDSKRAQEVAEMVGAQQSGVEASPRDGDGIDAALVTVPPRAHARITREYIGAGKSVFVEKPFTTTASEAAELTEEARRRNVTVAVNQYWRYYPGPNIGRRFLRGQLDEVRSIQASQGYRWDWPTASNYVIEDPYGGVIHDTGAHLVDMALYALGLDESHDAVSMEVDEVSKSPSSEPSHDCRARIILHASRNRSIEMELMMSRLGPLARGIKVEGSFGTLFIPSMRFDTPLLFRDGNGLGVHNAETMATATTPQGGFLLAHRDFLTEVRDPDTHTRIHGDRFLLLMRILEALHLKGGS
jgi:predicted dehydrogenase